jgi:hypothetical protein
MSYNRFKWDIDAYRSWAVAIAAMREQGIREGRITPETSLERTWAAEGPVPPQQLHAGKQHTQEAQ